MEEIVINLTPCQVFPERRCIAHSSDVSSPTTKDWRARHCSVFNSGQLPTNQSTACLTASSPLLLKEIRRLKVGNDERWCRLEMSHWPKLILSHWRRQIRLPNIIITFLTESESYVFTNVLCCVLIVYEGL